MSGMKVQCASAMRFRNLAVCSTMFRRLKPVTGMHARLEREAQPQKSCCCMVQVLSSCGSGRKWDREVVQLTPRTSRKCLQWPEHAAWHQQLAHASHVPRVDQHPGGDAAAAAFPQLEMACLSVLRHTGGLKDAGACPHACSHQHHVLMPVELVCSPGTPEPVPATISPYLPEVAPAAQFAAAGCGRGCKAKAGGGEVGHSAGRLPD